MEKKHRIILLDYNSNGQFNDRNEIDDTISKQIGKIYAKTGDMFLVDPDMKNPVIMGNSVVDRAERQHVSKLLNIDNQFFNTEISPAGDRLTITPSTLPVGNITNPNDNFTAVVYGDLGMTKISGKKNQPVSLPESNWKLYECKIDLTVPKTNMIQNLLGRAASIPYTMVAAAGTVKSPSVSVQKDKSVVLPFGPPYKPLVDVSPTGDNGKTVRLNMKLSGTGEETCSNMLVNGNQPAAPQFVLATPTGEIVERGKFEFG